MRNVYLHGSLGKKYGRKFELNVDTAGEAVRALCMNFPEMTADLKSGSWRVVRGKTPSTGFALNEEGIASLRLGRADLHIQPVMAGAKNNGALKAIIGVALIAVSFGSAAFLSNAIAPKLLGATTWGNAFGQVGLALAVSGVSQLLTSQNDNDANKNEGSFIMSGPEASAQQGAAIPLVYGEVITETILISGGMDAKLITP